MGKVTGINELTCQRKDDKPVRHTCQTGFSYFLSEVNKF